MNEFFAFNNQIKDISTLNNLSNLELLNLKFNKITEFN